MLDAIRDGDPVDALVNNAAGNFISRTEDLSPRAIDAVLSIVHRAAWQRLSHERVRPSMARRAIDGGEC